MKYWDVSWNPITGCTPISEGCANCYAKRMVEGGRLRGHERYPKGFDVTVHYDRLDKIPGKAGDRVFVCNMSDLFHEALWDNAIALVFHKMMSAPDRQYIVLTKRAARMSEFFSGWGLGIPDKWLIGVTAENQARLDERLPYLLATHAEHVFISFEPLLGPVSGFARKLNQSGLKRGDMVIVGGESGPNARPMNPEWARAIRDECQNAGVKFHMKQMSGRKAIPDDLNIQEWI